MEIGRYRRQVEDSFGVQGPRATGDNLALVAGNQVAATTERLAAHMAHAEQLLQKSRDELLASQISSGLRDTLTAAQEQITDTEGAAIQAEKVAKIGREWLTANVKGVADERVRNAILAHGEGIISTGALQARGIANTKIKESTQAGALAQISFLQSQGTPDALKEAQDLIAGLTAAGVFSAESGVVLADRARKDAVSNAFARKEAIDPYLALDEVTKGVGIFSPDYLDDADRERLRASVAKTIQTREAQVRADQERQDKQNEKLLKENWATNEAKIRYRLLNGDFSALNDIQKMGWSGSRELSEEGERRLLEQFEKVRKEKPDTPSDGPTKTRAILLSRSVDVSQKDRDWMAEQFKAGTLNSTDYVAADNEAQTNIAKKKEAADPFLTRKHAQAEQELRAKLGIPTMYDKLNPVKERVFAAALQELTDRSAYIGRGKEDPIAAVREMLPRYQAILLTDSELSLEQKAVAARYKTPKDLERAYQSGIIDKTTYDTQREVLLDIERVARDLLKGSTQAPPAGANTRQTIGRGTR